MARRCSIGDVTVTLMPAGHVLGSAQVVIEWQGRRAVISGDYKRSADPTCPAFERRRLRPVRHRGDLRASRVQPRRCAKARWRSCSSRSSSFRSAPMWSACMGSARPSASSPCCARRAMREPIFLHGALIACCEVYETFRRAARPAQARHRRQARGAEGRHRARAAVGDFRPLVEAAAGRAHRLRLGLDAGPRPRAPAGRRAAAGDLRSRRLEGADGARSRRRARARCGSPMGARRRCSITFARRDGAAGRLP